MNKQRESEKTPLGETLSGQVLVSGQLAFWLKAMALTIITLVAFEVVAVTTAMPYVVEALHGEQYYAFVSGVPLATQLITTALAGEWCDSKDPRSPLYIGAAGFMLGLVLATFSPNIFVLIAARAIQGLGAGLLIVPFYVMVGAYIKPSKQPAFFAAFSLAWVLPSLIGPVVAGFFVEYLHWRLVFGVCPILCIIAAPMFLKQLRAFPPIHENRPFRLGAKIISAAIVSGILLALLQSISGVKPEDFNLPFILAALGVSALLVLVARPLFPRGTFLAWRGVPSIVVIRGIVNGTVLSIELYLVLLLKELHDWGPTQAGFVITAGSVTWAVGSWVQGKIDDDKQRALLPIIGPAVEFAGVLIALAALIPGVSGWLVLIGWLLSGFGAGILYPAMTVYALALTDKSRHGEVSSALALADTMGAAVLVAYAGILYALFFGLGAGAFAIAIGSQCVLILLCLWLGRRILPANNHAKADCSQRY